jgi:hypothetical protein
MAVARASYSCTEERAVSVLKCEVRVADVFFCKDCFEKKPHQEICYSCVQNRRLVLKLREEITDVTKRLTEAETTLGNIREMIEDTGRL